MRLCFIFLLLALMRGLDCQYDSSEEIQSFTPDNTLNFKGNIRKIFILELGLREPGKNLICSPISVILPLGKLLLGVKSESKSETELLSAVGLKNVAEVKSSFQQIVTDIKTIDGVQLVVASKIYLSDEKKLTTAFKQKSQRFFHSDVELIDVTHPKESADKVNGWVSQLTKQKIKSIISKRDIKESVSLILVNAIYFKGNWKYPFHKAENDIFYAASGILNVPMMHRKNVYKYRFSKSLNAEILEIPYDGDKAAMIIVLPKERNFLPILLRTLKVSTSMLNDALARMNEVMVDVKIPKFKFETSLDLKEYYEKIGLGHVTDPGKSELDNIVQDETLHISRAVHKAVIHVNEIGTEAAAATALIPVEMSLALNIVKFRADHPFLFYIKANKEQIFAGIVNSP